MTDPKRILIADDSATVTTVLSTNLQAEGFVVDAVHNGEEAYEKGKTGEYDLIVLDQLMPGLLGIEIIERWLEDGVLTPVLMLSGVDDDRTVVDSLELGAVDFVRKPFRMPELIARIRQRLQA